MILNVGIWYIFLSSYTQGFPFCVCVFQVGEEDHLTCQQLSISALLWPSHIP